MYNVENTGLVLLNLYILLLNISTHWSDREPALTETIHARDKPGMELPATKPLFLFDCGTILQTDYLEVC